MSIDKEKFVTLKLNPSLANVENAIELFSGIGLNRKSLALLKKEVEAAAAPLSNDGKSTKSDEELLERLTSCAKDLESLASVVKGEGKKTESSTGIKAFGERFGAKYALHIAPEGKVFMGVFSGLAENLSERFPKLSQKNWTYLLRFLYIAGCTTGYLALIYLVLYWIMVASPSVTDKAEPLDVSGLNLSVSVEVAVAIESALLQDGSFNSKIDSLDATLKRISAIFDADDLAKAKRVSAFITAWPNGEEHVSDIFYGSAMKMAEHLGKYSMTDEIDALELARNELKPIENKLGYHNLVSAAAVVDQGDRMRATYNNEIDLSVAEYVQEFRQAHEAGDYYLAAYYYGNDLVATREKQIKENNERIEAEREAAAERQAMEAAAAAAAAAQAPPPEKSSGFLSSVGKGVVAGVALSKANDSGMVQATCYKCNHHETRPKPKGASYKNKCPRCGGYKFFWSKV